MPLHRLAGIFLLLLIPAIWYVDTSGNDNITSRAAMVTALAEHGELHIDRYKDVTGDKAYANGHYYSEKAPLPSLLMVPVWWLLVNSGIHGPTADGTISPALLAWSGVLIGSLPFIL